MVVDICQDPVQTASGSGEAEPDEARMVKAFRRSAAGDEVQLPSDLRPPAVLKRTCDYLFSEVIGNAPALEKVHHFVWDRTRAIRNDFSIQQLTKLDDLRIAIDCYERIARFHIVSLHELAGPKKPYGKYDPQQEREQLDRTLLSLMQYYEDTRGRLELQHEPEFRAYCVILQLRDPTPDLEDRIQSWPSSIANNYRVRTAVEVYTAACSTIWPEGPVDKTQHVIARQHWDKFWKLIESRKVSYLLACVAETHFMMIREMALSAIVRSARVPKRTDGVTEANTEWTVDEMDRLFYFDADEDLENFCARWNLHFQAREEDGKEYLDLRHLAGKSLPQGDAAKSNQVKSVLVEDKRHGRTLPAVIDGLSVRQARDAGLLVEEEEHEDAEVIVEDAAGDEDNDAAMEEEGEDENSLFIPEIKRVEEPATKPTDDSGAAKTSSFPGFAQTSSVFGKTTASSPFAPASPFGHPSSSFSFKPAETGQNDGNVENKSPFSFLSAPPKADESAKPASTSPFAPSKPSNFISPSTASFSELLGGTVSADSTKPAPSPFAQPAAASNTPANPFTPKASSIDTTTIATHSTTAPEKVSVPTPLFSFPSLTPKPEQPPTTEKPSFQFGSTNGVPAAPSLSAQPETNLKPPPQASQPSSHAQSHSPPNSPPTTHTAQNATISNSGSQSPPRRPSASSWEAHKTKKPSPLSNSFTAGEDSAAQAKEAQAKEPVRELFPGRESTKSPLPQIKPSLTQTSEAEFQLHKLAEHLTFNQDNGFLKQFLDFTVKQVILQAQEKVFDEKCRIKCQALEARRLIRKYGVWWRAFARHRRLFAKSRQRRERTRERLRQSTAGSSLHGFSDTDTIPTRRDSIPSAVQYQRSRKDVVDALFKSVAGNMQASAGSKRTAPSNGQDMATHKNALHKRQKSLSHADNSVHVSREMSTSHADLSKRSSFLGYSATGDTANQPSTTKTTYFRMKALGLGPHLGKSSTTEPRGTKRQRSESFDLGKIRSSRRSTSSTDAINTQQQRDAGSMAPPPTKPKQNDEDEALFTRLRRAREALLEGESLMKDELRRSMSASLSSNESPSMERARAEARLRHSELEGSVNTRNVPAYQFRDSRFVPREEYSLARERALERRASSSRENSRSVSRVDERIADTSTAAKSDVASKHQSFGRPNEDASPLDIASQPKVNGQAHTPQPFAATPAKPFPGFESDSRPSAHFAATAKPFSGFGAQPFSLQATSRDPCPQSSSFAPIPPAGSNPFLQATAPKPSGMAHVRPSNIENDQTIQPSQIDQSLARVFDRTDVSTTDGSRLSQQPDSYMPSQAASEAVTLLSDDEDGGIDEVSYGQRQYFGNGVLDRDGAQSGTQSFDNNDAGTAGLLQGAYEYTNSFAALADPSGGDESDGNDWDTNDETGQLAGGQGGSYQYSYEDVQESDEDDEAEVDEGGPNGYFDEEAEEYGDVEDDGDSDEEEGDYDEDEDGDVDIPPTQYPPRLPRPVAAGNFGVPTPNAELQAVGNTFEEAIELSD